MADTQSVIRELYAAVDGYVKCAFETLATRVGEIDARVKAIPAGPQGERGEKGEPGDYIKGDKGEPGDSIQGIAGPQGERGEKGDPGESLKGEKGDLGESIQGPAGVQGEKGESGVDGKDGASGVDGKDGLQGEAGAPGKDGERGLQGEPGPAGRDGKDGQSGEKGLDGRDGKDGRDGREGKDGASGRDALDLEILPAIDPTKNYPRGTLASHLGGLWRARSNTDGMNGWDVVVEGLASIAALQADSQRSFVLAITTTSGKAIELPFSVPAIIYRDTYRPDTEYQQGDFVTWDGGVWHCQAETTKEKPGSGSTDWKLAVKRGNHGRDGKDGTLGPRGPEGQKGKDLTQMTFAGEKY